MLLVAAAWGREGGLEDAETRMLREVWSVSRLLVVRGEQASERVRGRLALSSCDSEGMNA